MKITENIELLNCDCMEYMRTIPDNAFDLAICDPPYGGGNDGELNGGAGSGEDSTDTSQPRFRRQI